MAVTVFVNLLGPGLDVCPPVQEDLDGMEVAFMRSYVECSGPKLGKTQTQIKNLIHIHDVETNISVPTYIYKKTCNIS